MQGESLTSEKKKNSHQNHHLTLVPAATHTTSQAALPMWS